MGAPVIEITILSLKGSGWCKNKSGLRLMQRFKVALILILYSSWWTYGLLWVTKWTRVVIPALDSVQFIYFYIVLIIHKRIALRQQLLPKGNYSVIHGYICKMSALFSCANVSSSDSINRFVCFLQSDWSQCQTCANKHIYCHLIFFTLDQAIFVCYEKNMKFSIHSKSIISIIEF